MRIALPACLVAACSWTALQAQGRTAPIAVRDVSVRFEHLTVADGLSQTTIYAIHQDRFGFMWFATQDGLNRYDGHSIKVYRHEPFDSTGLGNNTVVAISEDRDGNLWVGTGRGLYRMSRGTEQFAAFRNDPNDPESFGSDRASHILEDRNGTLWVATQRGLDRFDKESETFTHYRNDPSNPASISHNLVLSVYEDLAGHVWVATAHGLNRIRTDLQGFDRFLESDIGSGEASLSNYAVQRILERPEEPGILWVATGTGLLRFDPESEMIDTFEPTSDPNARRVADLVQDPISTSVLWLAVPGTGLVRFDIRTGAFTIHGTDPTNPRGLSTTNTERVFGDRSGMLWVGVNGVGVDRFNPATVGMSHLRHDPGNPQSLPGSHVRGIYQDQDGGLWVGTRNRRGVSRVSHYDPTLRTFRHFGHRTEERTSLAEGIIRAVLIDRDKKPLGWCRYVRPGCHICRPAGSFSALQTRS